jgi:hypothetical protein
MVDEMNEVSSQNNETRFEMPYSAATDPEIQCVSACGQSGCYKASLARLACNLYESVKEIRFLDSNVDGLHRAVEISRIACDGVGYLERHLKELAWMGEDVEMMVGYYKTISDVGMASRELDGARGKEERASNIKGARASFDKLKRAVEKISEKDKYGVDVFVKHILDKYDW